MGRTLQSFAQIIQAEQASLIRFRRALRREDQEALDDLFRMAHYHSAESAYASHLLPFEMMLLAMLLEEYKLVLHMQKIIERLETKDENAGRLDL